MMKFPDLVLFFMGSLLLQKKPRYFEVKLKQMAYISIRDYSGFFLTYLENVLKKRETRENFGERPRVPDAMCLYRGLICQSFRLMLLNQG